MVGKCYYVKYTTDQRLPIFSYLNDKIHNTRNRFQRLVGNDPITVSETSVEKDININADTSSKTVTNTVSK